MKTPLQPPDSYNGLPRSDAALDSLLSAARGKRQWITDEPFLHDPNDIAEQITAILPAIDLPGRSSAIPISLMPRPTIHQDMLTEQATWIIPALPSRPATRTVSKQPEAHEYMGLLRQLMKNSGMYAVASLVSPLVSLVLAPFLTHALSHSEYGALVIMNTFVALLTGVTQLGIGDAFCRAYLYDYEARAERMAVLSTSIQLLCLLPMPIALGIVISAPLLSQLLLGQAAMSNMVKAVALVLVVQNCTVPGLAWLRAENRAVLFSILSVVNLLVTLSATMVLVGVLHMGAVGSLLATCSGYGVVALCTLPPMLVRAGLHFRIDMAGRMLAFGAPHIINLLSGWLLQLSDRYLLGVLGSLSQVASYSVAYSLGGILSSIIIMPFSMAWWVLMFPIAKRRDAVHVFQLIFRWFGLLLLLATFGLSLSGPVVLDWFFPLSYHAAAPVITVVALSILFNGIFVVFAVGTSIQVKTWLVAIYITCSAVLNIGLNIMLIPLYGSMGAAIATLVAYIALAIMAYCGNQRIYPVPFEVGKFTFALGIGVFLYYGDTLLTQTQGDYIAWSIRFSSLLLYAALLLLLGLYSGKKKD